MPPAQKPTRSAAATVGIFMPVYNRADYLDSTVESLIRQTFRDFVLIIADDGSTDDSLAIAKKWADRDDRITVLSLPHAGEVAARNAALAELSTRYLLNHDSDDISLPTKLETLVGFLEKHPEIALVGCHAEYFDDTGRHLGSPALEDSPARIRATFDRVNSLIHSATLFRREVYETVGPYRGSRRGADDYDLFSRALMAGFEAANVSPVLHRIRMHPGSIVSSSKVVQGNLAYAIGMAYRQSGAQRRWRTLDSRHRTPAAAGPSRHKLSILHTVEFYHPHIGGAETVVQKVSEELVRRGHQVTVATTQDSRRTTNVINGVLVAPFEVAGKSAERITGEAGRYRSFLLDHPADVVMHYAAQQWATDIALDTIGHTRGRRVNVLAPCGYSWLLPDGRVKRRRHRNYFASTLPAVLPLFDAVVFHSPIFKDCHFHERLGLANGAIVRNGCDDAEFATPAQRAFRLNHGITTRFMGLCVANYLPEKSHARLIEVVRAMRRSDFTLVCIGRDAPLRGELERRAKGLPIQWLTHIDRSETVAAYQEADIFLFASHIEAAPLVIIEAKAAGVPFVSTDVGNVRELTGGIVCSPHNMAQHANTLLDDDLRRRALGEAGRREWQTSLTWTRVIDEWENLYLRLHAAKTESITRRTRSCRPEPSNTILIPQQKAIGVVFSKDRPLQLDATLASWKRHGRDAEGFTLAVLYAASSPRMESLYRQLRREHPDVHFVREHDFRNDLLTMLGPYAYVMFVVDDCLFVRDVSVKACMAALDQDDQALGVSLRLGRNAEFCYSANAPQRVPNMQLLEPASAGHSWLRYRWGGSDHDFGYPLEVSSSFYRLADLEPLLREMAFRNPNQLEDGLARRARTFLDARPMLLNAETSLAFCNPCNRVQDAYANRAGATPENSSAALANAYASGMRVRVADLDGFTPMGCHQEVILPLEATAQPVPRVSVVIPCYKQAQFLEDAVASVIGQSFKDWELVIVDDGSPDDTATVAERLIATHPDKAIQLLRKPNGGLSDARNQGITVSRGEFVLPLDADDVLEPAMLAECVAALDGHPDVSFVYCDMMQFGALPNGKTEELICRKPFDRIRPRHRNRFNYCSLYRHSLWRDIGGYADTMTQGFEDWDFWVRAMAAGHTGRHLPKTLFRYRVKQESMLTQAMNHERSLKARLVLNSPSMYSRRQQHQARNTLMESPLPPCKWAPLVSVVIPCFGRPDSLHEAIQSVAEQTLAETCRSDVELVIAVSGGTDITDTVRTAAAGVRTRLIHLASGKSRAACRNAAMRMACGRYIAHLREDHAFEPDHLDRLLDLLRSSGLAWAYSDASEVVRARGPDGRSIELARTQKPSQDYSRSLIRRSSLLASSTSMHDRTCVLKAGEFRESLHDGEEHDLWRRFARHFLASRLPVTSVRHVVSVNMSPSLCDGRR